MTRKHSFQHLLSIKDLSEENIRTIFDVADEFLCDGEIVNQPTLKGVKVAHLFYEPSTRTRLTFEIAAKSLSADSINFNIAISSTQKGEGMIDTLQNLEAMGIKIFVVRHASNGAPYLFASHVQSGHSIINAGDGSHEHPTQALLDMATLRHYCGDDFSTFKVAIIGDILHSRVARSQIYALKTLGVDDIRVIAPETLIPQDMMCLEVRYFNHLEEGLQDVNVVLCLRLQKERMDKALIPSEQEFFNLYGISARSLCYADKEAVVLHPGPVNRGVEIASEVINSKQSLILKQVTQGIAIRMAVMSLCQQ